MSKIAFFDLTGSRLSVYALEKNGKTLAAGDTVSVDLAEDYSFNLAPAAGVRDSYLSLPLRLLNFRVVELPFSDVNRIRELLPFETEGLILDGPEGVVFDAVVLEKADGKNRVLVAYLAKNILRKILAGLKAAGFDPKAVTSVELAHVLSSSSSARDLADRLLEPKALSEKERVQLSAKEVSAPTVNFRRGEFAYTADTEKTRKSLRLTMVLTLLLLLVFLSDTVVTVLSIKKELHLIRGDIRKTYQDLFPNEKKITNELYQLKARVKEYREKESSFAGTSPLQVLLDLSRAAKPGVALTEVTAEKELIVIKGECPTMSDVQKVKADLEEFFTGVSISDTKPSSQNRTLFTITAKGRKA